MVSKWIDPKFSSLIVLEEKCKTRTVNKTAALKWLGQLQTKDKMLYLLHSWFRFSYLSIYKKYSLHPQGQCVGNLKGLPSFLLLCCQAISCRRRNGEWDSPWVIPRFTLARSNFLLLNYELITWPWICLSEGAAAISRWQNVIFVFKRPDVNVPLQQPAKWSELSLSDSAQDCKSWQTLQMCCSFKNASPAPGRRLGHLLPANKAPSVTVPAHQGVGWMLTYQKTSGLILVLGMFAQVFKIKSYIWKWDFDREKYSVSNMIYIKNKEPNSSVHHSRIKLMNFHGVKSSEKLFRFEPS